MTLTNSLTGGSSPAPHVGFCLDGLGETAVDFQPVPPTSVSIYVGDTVLTMAKLLKLQSATLDVKSRHKGVFTLDDGEPSFSYSIDPPARP